MLDLEKYVASSKLVREALYQSLASRDGFEKPVFHREQDVVCRDRTLRLPTVQHPMEDVFHQSSDIF
jgi:hypothetical protein